MTLPPPSAKGFIVNKQQKLVRNLIKTKASVNISLGGEDTNSKSFINVDIQKGPLVDVVWDLEDIPWPFPSNCADLLVASHIVEHINPMKMGFIKFMDECWRVLKPGGQMMVATPYAGSLGYWQDPTHVNGCVEVTWYYFDPLQKIGNLDLYHIYKPKPWKVESVAWHEDSNMEVVMIKRKEDKSYD